MFLLFNETLEYAHRKQRQYYLTLINDPHLVITKNKRM